MLFELELNSRRSVIIRGRHGRYKILRYIYCSHIGRQVLKAVNLYVMTLLYVEQFINEVINSTLTFFFSSFEKLKALSGVCKAHKWMHLILC